MKKIMRLLHELGIEVVPTPPIPRRLSKREASMLELNEEQRQVASGEANPTILDPQIYWRTGIVVDTFNYSPCGHGCDPGSRRIYDSGRYLQLFPLREFAFA
jgi:hypothetical protein